MAHKSIPPSLDVAPGSFISPVFNVDTFVNGHKVEFSNGFGIRTVTLQHIRQALTVQTMFMIRWQGSYQKAQLTFVSAATARHAARHIVYMAGKPGNPAPKQVTLMGSTVIVEGRHEVVLTSLEMDYEGLQTWTATDIYDDLDSIVPRLKSLLADQEPGVSKYLSVEMCMEDPNPAIQIKFRDQDAYVKYGQLVRQKAEATLTNPVFSLVMQVRFGVKARCRDNDFISRVSHIRDSLHSVEDIKLAFPSERSRTNNQIKLLVIIGERAAVTRLKKAVEAHFEPQALLGGVFYATSRGYQQLLATNILANCRVRVTVHGGNPFTTALAKSSFKGSDTRLLDTIKAAVRVLDSKCCGCQDPGMRLDWCGHVYCPGCLTKQVTTAEKWPVRCQFCHEKHARPIMVNTMSLLLTGQDFRRSAERALAYHAAQRPDEFVACPTEGCGGLVQIGPWADEITYCASCLCEICVACRKLWRAGCVEHASKTASGRSGQKR